MIELELFAIFLTVGVLGLPQYAPEYTGPEWQAKQCPFKLAALKAEIDKDHTPNGWYSIRVPEILLERMNMTFDSVMDDMPAQNLFDLEERPKLIHSVGAIATCRFVSNGQHNYTGIFTGSETGFIRFSIATKPTTSPPNIIAGISVKFMRSNVPSANVMAMYGLTGQDSFNFFEHDLTNQPPMFDGTQASLIQKALLRAFETASSWPTYLGLNGLSMFNSNGKHVAYPVFPYRLIFHPTANYHKLFPSTPSSDDSFFIPQFESMPMGRVYDVYAIDSPTSGPKIIGYIETTSQATGTKWGDKDMFFQHTRMEDDIALRPDWLPDMIRIVREQKTHWPPVAYPDLPF